MYFSILTVVCILICFIVVVFLSIYMSINKYLLWNMHNKIECSFREIKRINILKFVVCYFKGHIHTDSLNMFACCSRCNCTLLNKKTWDELQKDIQKAILKFDSGKL